MRAPTVTAKHCESALCALRLRQVSQVPAGACPCGCTPCNALATRLGVRGPWSWQHGRRYYARTTTAGGSGGPSCSSSVRCRSGGGGSR